MLAAPVGYIELSGGRATYRRIADPARQGLVKEIESCTRTGAVNIKSARRRIADRLIEENVYKF